MILDIASCQVVNKSNFGYYFDTYRIGQELLILLISVLDHIHRLQPSDRADLIPYIEEPSGTRRIHDIPYYTWQTNSHL